VSDVLAQRVTAPEKAGEFEDRLYGLPMRQRLDEQGQPVLVNDQPVMECAIETPEMQRLYVLLTRRLRDDVEAHGGTTLEYMLAERIVATFVMIRDKEITGSWGSERYHKETTALYSDMQSKLQHAFASYNRQEYRDRLLIQMSNEIQRALESQPKDIRVPAFAAIAEHLEAVELN
jgi:hypothetical protein